MYSDFLPKYIYWELCDQCNLSCQHCFANSNPYKNKFADKIRIFEKIDEIVQLNKVPIRFGGGEPFLVPYLLDLFGHCIKIGIDVSVTTNGTLLTQYQIDKLKTLNLKSITVSIDGTEEYNDLLRGKGNFTRACNGLSLLLQAGLHVSVAFTITALNFCNLEQYVHYFYTLGVRQFYFFRYISDNSRNEQLKLNGDTLFETTKMIIGIKNRYLDASFYYEKIGLLSFLVDKGERSAKCNFTKGIITIKYDGTVVVCAAISKNLGNIYYDSLEKIYANIALEINKIEDIPVECKSCSYSKLCKGGCKSSAYSNYASYGYKDECCFKEAFLYSSRL